MRKHLQKLYRWVNSNCIKLLCGFQPDGLTVDVFGSIGNSDISRDLLKIFFGLPFLTDISNKGMQSIESRLVNVRFQEGFKVFKLFFRTRDGAATVAPRLNSL